jgi:sialidase-1
MKIAGRKKLRLFRYVIWLGFIFCGKQITAQENQNKTTVQISEWKGFERYDFQFENKDAWLVLPKKAIAGKPWLWRARFPGYHSEADSILASEGFHIAHINTAGMLGNPESMDIWDRFYTYLTSTHNLNKKVALSGVSRGGLFIYTWAKRNPKKVTCIYGDAPVCDIKSWPGGFGEGVGAKEVWNGLKEKYGFQTEEEAKAYANNPIDNLEILAAEKIPILHMIGLEDEIVPADENTFILVNRYLRLGGTATVVPCTKGKQSLQGHHYPIETPRLVADFIKYHSIIPNESLDASAYHHLRGGIRNSFKKFVNEKKGRVAFLGGSITYNGGWRDSIVNYLTKRFPTTEFDFIAAGIPSMGSTPAAFRLERDVLKNGPVDLIFEEAAVNDAGNGRTTEDQLLAMEGIVRHVRKDNPAADVVLMHFVDPDKMETYRTGKIPEVIQNHEAVAEHYNIPSINLAKEVTERIDAGEFSWESDFKNLHPSPFGQGIYFHSMKIFLENAWQGIVAADDKIVTYELPNALNAGNYENGIVLPVKNYSKQKGWAFIENWQPTDGMPTRENYTKVPMLINKGTGKTLKLNFEGNAAGIAIAAGPDAGIIAYSIDGSAWRKTDLFTPWSSSLHLPWYNTLVSGLEEGKHRLKIKVLEEKNTASTGYTCRIRYFFVNGTE